MALAVKVSPEAKRGIRSATVSRRVLSNSTSSMNVPPRGCWKIAAIWPSQSAPRWQVDPGTFGAVIVQLLQALRELSSQCLSYLPQNIR
jgi:hypothetical protein